MLAVDELWEYGEAKLSNGPHSGNEDSVVMLLFRKVLSL